MRSMEKREVLYIATKLFMKNIDNYLKENSFLKLKDVARQLGIEANRLSEFKNYEKYKRMLTESQLKEVVFKKFLCMEDLMDEVKNMDAELSHEAKTFIDTLELFEKEEILETILEAKRKGIDIKALLENEIKKN